MRVKLFTVEDHFQITGRGLVIVGKKEERMIGLKIGTPIIIVTPEDRELEAKIDGIEMFSPPNFKIEAFLLRNSVASDIPIGSIVYIEENKAVTG